MINLFSIEKAKPSKTRKLPFFPRFGIVIDFGGRKFSYRQAPLTETLLNLFERGPTASNLHRIIAEQISEIGFSAKSEPKTLDVKSKTIAANQKK